jgi:xanthine dehydrogenase small subunit
MRRFASAQIRNTGTLCGNIANGSPIGDLPPALIALGAEIVLRKGDRQRVIALQDYFLAYQKQDREPGEFVEAVRVPLPPAGALFRVHKVSKRRDEDISAVCAAHYVEVEDGRVAAVRLAYGGMAATPKRATATEQSLLGQVWGEPAIRMAQDAMAEDFAPISDMRASAAYRMTVATNLLWRSFLEMGGAGDTQIPDEWCLAHA